MPTVLFAGGGAPMKRGFSMGIWAVLIAALAAGCAPHPGADGPKWMPDPVAQAGSHPGL